jgi:hypothetical protein
MNPFTLPVDDLKRRARAIRRRRVIGAIRRAVENAEIERREDLYLRQIGSGMSPCQRARGRRLLLRAGGGGLLPDRLARHLSACGFPFARADPARS